MTTVSSTGKIKAYVKQNWFRLGLALLLIFIALRKDLSFQINLNTPVKIETPPAEEYQPVRKTKEKTRETLTENKKEPQVPSASNNPASVEYFEFPAIGLGKKERGIAIDWAAVSEEDKQAFFKRFAHVAVSERKKFGIPSSIILASGLLHSAAGNRDISREGNNFFALPCTHDWQGESGTYNGICFRHYENAWTSFRDHSLYVTTGRFSQLRELGNTNYQGWAKALEEKGVSQQPDLANQLLQIIKAYQLDELDKE